MLGLVVMVLSFCLGFYLAALSKQKEQQKIRKLHDNMAYFKGVPYPVCYITNENYRKYEALLLQNVIYVLTDDEKKQNWSLDK